jgi:hypothetical protein
MKVLTGLIAAAVCAASVPLNAHAGAAAGGSIGSARLNGGDFEGSDFGWKGYVGSYGRILGGEVAYVNFGKLGGHDAAPEAQAYDAALLVGGPVGMAKLYGKAGVAFLDVEGYSVEQEVHDSERDTRFFYGAGVRLGGDRGLGARLEYERFRLASQDEDMASAGLEFRF